MEINMKDLIVKILIWHYKPFERLFWPAFMIYCNLLSVVLPGPIIILSLDPKKFLGGPSDVLFVISAVITLSVAAILYLSYLMVEEVVIDPNFAKRKAQKSFLCMNPITAWLCWKIPSVKAFIQRNICA